jgi:hypothetical protein
MYFLLLAVLRKETQTILRIHFKYVRIYESFILLILFLIHFNDCHWWNFSDFLNRIHLIISNLVPVSIQLYSLNKLKSDLEVSQFNPLSFIGDIKIYTFGDRLVYLCRGKSIRIIFYGKELRQERHLPFMNFTCNLLTSFSHSDQSTLKIRNL